MNTKFIQASLKERELLIKFFNLQGISDYQLTSEEEFDKYDAIVKDRAIIEVKIRNKKSDDFNTTIIEAQKYDYLISESRKLGLKPILMVYFERDNTLMLWDLSKQPRYIIRLYCPSTTMGCNTKALKECVDISIFNADKTIKM